MEKARQPYQKVILVCLNEREPGEEACGLRGSGEILRALKDYVKAHGLKKLVRVTASGCLDLCAVGPNVFVMPEGTWYTGVTTIDVERIIEEQLRPLEPTQLR